jgi:MFS family permease
MDARCTTITTSPRPGLYHGWLIVAAAFLVAVFGWGLGFYGLGIYLVALRDQHAWPAADIASGITGYYILSAALTFFFAGAAFERYGARRVVAVGMLAMGAGVAALTAVTCLWQVYLAFAVMAVGCATMTGASISIIVAPWFDRRRGFALSLALNGASVGGLIMAPLLIFLIDRFGFAAALQLAAASMVVVLVPLLAFVMRPRRPGERHWADDPAAPADARGADSPAAPFNPAATLRDPRFLTIAVPFALGLTAQVGFLTHQVAFLAPIIGTATAGWAVSLTTCAAVIGRLGIGLFVDRVDRRVTAGANFLVQMSAMGILMSIWSAPALLAGCFLFGLGLGNLISLPALIVQEEFPKRDFARLVSMIVAINQFTFAFGPGLLGWLQQGQGTYAPALLACLVMQTAAAVIVLLPIMGRMRRSR